MINVKDCQTALITVDFLLIPALPFSQRAGVLALAGQLLCSE